MFPLEFCISLPTCPIILTAATFFNKYHTTCVKAFAFQSPNKGPLEAQYKRQSLLFEIWFNKLLLGKKLFLGNWNKYTAFDSEIYWIWFYYITTELHIGKWESLILISQRTESFLLTRFYFTITHCSCSGMLNLITKYHPISKFQ